MSIEMTYQSTTGGKALKKIEKSSELLNLTFELESALGSIGDRVLTLVDTEILLGQLIGEMDTAAHRGQEMVYYAQHQRELRVLGELIHYLLKDLNKNYQNAQEFRGQLFKMVKADSELKNEEAMCVKDVI